MPVDGPFNARAIRRARARVAGRLRDQGLTLREISERLGVTHVTVITDLASLPAFPYDIAEDDDDDPNPERTIRVHT